MKKLGNKGQLSVEGIIAAVIGVIMYIIVASYVFLPIYTAMKPQLENTGGTYGTTASTIIMVLIYIIIPVLLIASAFMLIRPRPDSQV